MSELKIGYARVPPTRKTSPRSAMPYVDHGLTGTHRDRPGLRQALAAHRAARSVPARRRAQAL